MLRKIRASDTLSIPSRSLDTSATKILAHAILGLKPSTTRKTTASNLSAISPFPEVEEEEPYYSHPPSPVSSHRSALENI